MKLMKNWQDSLGCPTLVEFPDNILINGNYYDKETLNPKPFYHFNMNSGNSANANAKLYNSVVLKKFWSLTDHYQYNQPQNIYFETTNIWYGRYETNIAYIFSLGRHYGSNYISLWKYNYIDNYIITVNNATLADANGYWRHVTLFDESAGYLYICGNYVATNDGSYIYNITKDTLVFTSYGVNRYSVSGYHGFSTSRYSFIYYSLGYDALFHNYTIDKSVGAGTFATTVQTVTFATGYQCIPVPTTAKQLTPTTALTYVMVPTTTTSQYNKIVKLLLNGTDGAPSITQSAVTLTPSTALPSTNISSRSILLKLQFIGSAKEYLMAAQFENNLGTYLPINLSYVSVLKIVDDNTMTFKSTINELGIALKGVFPFDDYWEIIGCIYSDCVKVYKFNYIGESYELKNIINTSIASIGVDDLNRIWFVDNSTDELHMTSNNIPLSISITTELDVYKYDGVIIDTYLNIAAYNYLNEFMMSNIKIILIGDMIFTDGTKEKIVMTSTSNVITVPVKITGSNYAVIKKEIIL